MNFNLTKKSAGTGIMLVVWGLIAMFSVPAATTLLLILAMVGILTVLDDAQAFAKQPEGTFGDTLVGWAVVGMVAYHTFPFVYIFCLYVALEVAGGVYVYSLRKDNKPT